MREPFRKFIEKELKNGFLLIACGLPATAKSGAVEVIRQIRGGAVLSTDVLRREVLKDHDIFDSEVAGDMKKRTQVYDVMFEMADEAFKNNKNVILDATFVTQAFKTSPVRHPFPFSIPFQGLRSSPNPLRHPLHRKAYPT